MPYEQAKAKGAFNNNMGLSYYQLNNYDSALYYYQKSLEIAYALPDSFFIGLVSGNVGGVLMVKNYAEYMGSHSPEKR